MHRFLNTLKTNGLNYHLEKPVDTNGSTPSPFTSSSASERSDDDEASYFYLDQSPVEIPDPIDGNHIDGAELAALVAQYGHAPDTAWLESARYRIWRPSEPVSQSSFLPVQGYLHTTAWVFAWGGPLVSDAAALKPTMTQFATCVQSHDLRLVYCCIPEEVEDLLVDMGWSTVSCTSEDLFDPQHILEMTQDDDEGGHGSMVKDLKKNLRRAERANVEVKCILQQDWSDDLKREVEDGIAVWKQARKGLQLAAVRTIDQSIPFTIPSIVRRPSTRGLTLRIESIGLHSNTKR